EQNFKEYDQKLEALSSINVSEVIDEAIQAKVLTEMKKQLPTHVPKAIATFVKPRLNNSVRELKLLNRMTLNKSFENHDTHQKLYDILYESITLNQKALDAQDTKPSLRKRSHDDQDPPNDREGENRSKRRKDTRASSSISSKKDKAPSGSAEAAKRKTTWFDMLLISDIDQNEDHILGLSTLAVAKKLKELIKKEELTITDLEGVGLEMLKKQYKNYVELEYHVNQLKEAMLTKA
ncbi:hypothetical protein Tco_0887946, partial [Tanacetum coccineum]